MANIFTNVFAGGFLRKDFEFLPNSQWLDIPEVAQNICAVKVTSTECVIYAISGKSYDPRVTQVARRLYKQFPKLVHRDTRNCSFEELAKCYQPVEVRLSSEQTNAAEYISNQILLDAINAKASDVKIVLDGETTYIRLAIAGREYTYAQSYTASEGNALLHLLFDVRDAGSGAATLQNVEFQPFSITHNEKSESVIPKGIAKLRGQMGFHEGPVKVQKHCVFRLFFERATTIQPTEALGFDPEVCKALHDARQKMSGAVILGGVTGDGKTTTIISALNELYDQENGNVSIISAEDPVEFNFNLKGVIQIPIQSSSDAETRKKNYIDAIRHFLRSKPHVGLISELRDLQAAQVMSELVETGHQAWSTIHVSSAVGILFRIIDLGVPPAHLAKPDSFALLMKQSLVRVLCPNCKIQDDTYFKENPEGCPVCQAGHKTAEGAKAWACVQRLLGVAEFVVPDEEFLNYIRENNIIGATQHWRKTNITLGEKLGILLEAGQISKKEAVRKGAILDVATDARTEKFRAWVQSNEFS